MSITSFTFLVFCTITFVVYDLVPARFQWMVLLGASFVYYLTSGSPVLVVWPLLAVTVTWLGVRLLGSGKVPRRAVLALELVVLLGILVAFKYTGLFVGDAIALTAPLGLSFYTFILLGYFIDVYNGIAVGTPSWGRTALMGMYFPLMTSGPIANYREENEPFFTPHKLCYGNLTYGVQRMLWGFFKELVISQRCATLAASIFGADESHPGAYIWVGAAAFTVELYTNFSGCMDIALGLSECLGMTLPENFRTPFLSRNISEFWRRWHITLSTWLKDHVFYPLLRTSLIQRQGKWLRARLGKKLGKNLNTWLAMFVLWFVVGLWHGGDWKYVFGVGLLQWAYIVFGEATLPFWQKVCGALHLDLHSKGMDVFRVVRTFVLMSIAFVFFNADSMGHALRMLREGVTTWNPEILVNGALLELGLAWDDYLVLGVSLVILIAVSAMQYRAEIAGAGDVAHTVRHYIASRPIVVRWIIWMVFAMLVILWGQYGPDFSSAEFIYQGF